MATYVSMNNYMFDKLVEWGARLPKREDGSYAVIPTGPMTAIIGVDLDITLKVRQTAEKKGVKIIDKVSVTDLLTSDGRIAGAVGFSLLDGKLYTFNAKAVVLATGSQNYRIGPMWSSGRETESQQPTERALKCATPSSATLLSLLRYAVTRKSCTVKTPCTTRW